MIERIGGPGPFPGVDHSHGSTTKPTFTLEGSVLIREGATGRKESQKQDTEKVSYKSTGRADSPAKNEHEMYTFVRNKGTEAPGWLSQLSFGLRLRS